MKLTYVRLAFRSLCTKYLHLPLISAVIAQLRRPKAQIIIICRRLLCLCVMCWCLGTAGDGDGTGDSPRPVSLRCHRVTCHGVSPGVVSGPSLWGVGTAAHQPARRCSPVRGPFHSPFDKYTVWTRRRCFSVSPPRPGRPHRYRCVCGGGGAGGGGGTQPEWRRLAVSAALLCSTVNAHLRSLDGKQSNCGLKVRRI